MGTTDTCRWCHGTGWATLIDYDGSGYDVPCPGDCPPVSQPAGDMKAPY